MSEHGEEYWTCPLIQAEILDAVCIEITFDLEGMCMSDEVEKMSARTNLSREGIHAICLARPNNPLPEPKDGPAWP